MSFFKNIREKWSSMSTGEKIKLAVCGVCDIGADLLAGLMLCRVVPENEKKWKKAAMIVTAGGLGMWAGNVASREINGCIDLITGSGKPEQKEEPMEEEEEDDE